MTKLRGNPWAVLVVVSLGFFMTLLDLTIVNIAIPNMIDKLHASLDDVLWVLNAYALVLAVLVITAGRLGDLLGPRTMFVAGIAVFTVASAACGFAPSPAALIAFRAPNTQEIVGRFSPTLLGAANMRTAGRLGFSLRPAWAIGLGVLATLCVLSLSQPAEFLYFQF